MGVDRFKRINDEYGRATGDQLIIDLAALLERSVHRSESVYRLGGEEFVLMLRGVDDGELGAIANKLLDVIRKRPGRPGNV